MTWSPLSCVFSNSRSRSGVHSSGGPWMRRYSSSRSRSRARSSAAIGASSGAGAIAGRASDSPRSSVRTPEIQPRRLSCATTIVASAITSPSTAISAIRY